MNTSTLLKGMGALVTLGTVSAGAGATVDRNSGNELDRGAYGGGEGWKGTKDPSSEPTELKAGQELKVSLILQKGEGNEIKKGVCSIAGTIPEDATGTISSKVKEQLDQLATGLGLTNGTSGTPADYTKSTEEATAKKMENFFEKCIGRRNFSQWREARWGGIAESIIRMEIKKVTNGSSAEYKFEETKFKALYGENVVATATTTTES